MNYYHWIIPIALILILGGLYIGKKITYLWNPKTKKEKIIYWIIVYSIASSLIFFRSIGAGFLLYFVLFHVGFDLFRFIFHSLKFQRGKKILETIFAKGIPIIILSLLISIYGFYNMNHPIIKNYDVKIKNTLVENISIGMISDLHLGTRRDDDILDEITKHATEINADIFILGGDIFDEYTTKEMKEKAMASFAQIKSKYGIYYVEGNHDLLTPELKNQWESYGIRVLDDKVVSIADKLYLIGRKDLRRDKLGEPRKDLKELLLLTKKDTPKILIDHQPVDQKNAEDLGIDLQLSGHTHGGQIFPGNLFLQYGYKNKNNYHIIVSSGYGVWGFPIRTAGRSEMLNIKLSN